MNLFTTKSCTPQRDQGIWCAEANKETEGDVECQGVCVIVYTVCVFTSGWLDEWRYGDMVVIILLEL